MVGEEPVTFSILAHDPATGRFGGAASTGNLCVGGWVLRGDARAGVSAAQGAVPSPLWGQVVLERMAAGMEAPSAVEEVVAADPGRAARQLAALGPGGRAGAFTGEDNPGAKGARLASDLVVSGNMLSHVAVLDAIAEGYAAARGDLELRLLAALAAGAAAGGDFRGLMSAALLVVGMEVPTLSLRIDWSDRPIEDLAALYARTRDPGYQAWLETVPTLADPNRR